MVEYRLEGFIVAHGYKQLLQDLLQLTVQYITHADALNAQHCKSLK
ncbi:MAG: hypothetical protein ACYDEV_07555 [Acidiferrobacter sp.]